MSVRRETVVLLAIVLFRSGPLFAQAPALTDVDSELSRFQDIDLRLVRFLSGKEIVIPSTTAITLTFQKEKKISGRSAVNRYGGVFTTTPNGEISIQLTTVTQMAGPPELMELEKQYFDALSHVRKILVKSDRIILQNDTTSIEFAVPRAR